MNVNDYLSFLVSCGVVLMEGILYLLGGKDLNDNVQVTTVQTLSI